MCMTAQIQTTQQRLEAIIGSLMVQNADLATRVEILTQELEAARAAPVTKPKAKSEPSI
jgi:hypothetical protein